MSPVIYEANKTEEPNLLKHAGHRHHKKNRDGVMRGEHRSRNPLSSFVIMPKNFRLSVQDEEEEILLLMRRHWVTNISWMIIGVLMILAPLLLARFPAVVVLPIRFQIMTGVLWYLITLGYLVESFLSWFFNVYIITDERVIDVDFLNLLYKNISSTKIDKIEDVTVEMSGAIRSMFNFGSITIQTAAEKREFEFEDVPHPQKVAKFLNEMILEEEQEAVEGRVR